MTQLDSTERNIEAILFASGEPMERERLAEVLQAEPHLIDLLVRKIRDRYQAAQSSLDIVTLGDAYQMCTMPQYGPVIRSALELRRGMMLSQAALEVLAVVAYHQPVTRSFVEQVRGVDCSSLIRSLTEKRLIEEAGRMNIPGKPIVYRTTANFLRCFGLGGIDQLPVLPNADSGPVPGDDQLEGQIDFFEED